MVATLHGSTSVSAERLLTVKLFIAKILISFFAILGGSAIGREGPTVHVGVALMFNLCKICPKPFRSIGGVSLERRLRLAGVAAALSAAFNTPLAGVVFTIEELICSFGQRASCVLITAIIFAGVSRQASTAVRCISARST